MRVLLKYNVHYSREYGYGAKSKTVIKKLAFGEEHQFGVERFLLVVTANESPEGIVPLDLMVFDPKMKLVQE